MPNNTINFGNKKTYNLQRQLNISNLGAEIREQLPILKKVRIDCLPGLAENTVMKENKQISDESIRNVEQAKTTESFIDTINYSKDLEEVKYLQNCIRAFAGYYNFGAAKTGDMLKMLDLKNKFFNKDEYIKEGIITEGIEALELIPNLPQHILVKIDELNKQFDLSDGSDFNDILNKLYALKHEIKTNSQNNKSFNA